MLERSSDGPAENSRNTRARLSLEGLSCGDAFGERFFAAGESAAAMIKERSLPAPPWFFTDDTLMALSIVELLKNRGTINQNELAKSFGLKYDSSRAYGAAMHDLLPKLRKKPESWKDIASKLFRGEGSFGNGSAMRVAPLGAYFADDLEKTVEQAELSSVITHSHPEAIAGAIAVAVAAAMACQYKVRNTLPSITEFIGDILEFTPMSYVRKGLEKAQALAADTSIAMASRVLGNGSAVTAPDTIPFALWAAARHLNNYEEAIWHTASAQGDQDTNCAIVGGVVVLYSGMSSIHAMA